MKLVRLGFCIIILSLFVACAAPSKEVKEAASFPIEVTDQLGRVVRLEKIPERIISLAPSNTEILFALGLGERVVAVTEYCNYPPAAQEKPKIGGFSTPNIEKVVALSPDLVLATSIHEKEIIPALEGKGLTIFTLDPKTVDEVLKSITLVGEVTGREETASRLVEGMQNRIKAVTDKTANLIKMAGGTNIARDLIGYATISLEAIIEANPQVIIAGIGMGSGEDLPFQYVRNEPRLRNVDACVNHRVYSIDVDLCGRPGPRIVDALEKFAEFIHPELFKKD